jgi:hypothetical protein
MFDQMSEAINEDLRNIEDHELTCLGRRDTENEYGFAEDKTLPDELYQV